MKENIEELITVSSPNLQEPMVIGRVLGKYGQRRNGPALIVTAGVHGNEPSGIIAFKKVQQSLTQMNLPLRGELTGLAGNIAALSQNVRLIDKDLNRVCFVENEEKLKTGMELGYQESREFFALIKEVEAAQYPGITEVYFLDLHTTSSSSQPYISVNRDSGSYSFANKFPLYIVKGIEDYIPGHVDYYLNHKGHKGCTIEAGQHDALSSIENHEAAIWLALVFAGCLEKEDLPDFCLFYDKLKEYGDTTSSSFEVIYRYEIAEGESFKMMPGFVNFQKIGKGDIIARSDGRNIVSEWDARIFMPLYQAQGKDGFFVVQEC
ncbi:MAG TPA: succinylglutamate desuccinylase/aspartoacylase family protein [Cyclobacteriaceae bacterium]|nr:succinylglutamate desuccinylase/aspartoacylase family protein [Cyclobacteriaceae bacterium]